MSFLSAADVLKGIELCKWIYENCFEKVGRADARYLQFGKDVGKLRPTLRRLLPALERTLQLRNPGSLDEEEPLEREARELIGDFNATLEECREILENNRGIVRDGSGFVQDVIWGASTHKRVEELRNRIQFHVQKIEIFMASVRLEQSNTIDDGIQELLVHIRELRGLSSETQLEPIPEWLDSRFCEALEINPPASYTDIENFPLEHGFEALYHHYKQSTVVNVQSGDRTMEQYLGLLKAHWILKTLPRGRPFQALRPGSCYPRAVGRLSELISEQYARPGLATFDEEDLRKLDNSSFLIWLVQKETPPRQLTEPDGLEEKILQISLSGSQNVRKEELMLFQRGPTTLRLARSIVPANGPLRQESEKINTHIDRFIPLYAVPSSKSGSPALAMKICDGKETGGSVYEFKSEADVFSLQRAATGFEVVSDMNKVYWSLNRKKKKLFSTLLANTGRMQVWYWNPLSPSRMFQAGSSEPLDSGKASSQWHSSASSPDSHGTNSTVAKVVNGASKASFSAIESEGGETVVAVNTRPPPILLIFSKIKGEYTFFHLQLRPGMTIVETSCECGKSKETCRRTVIENISNKDPIPFTVRRLAISEAQLDLWDLSVFGLPEHPHFKDPRRVEKLKCDYLDLEFPSVADRKKFNSHLRLAFKFRDEAQESSKRTMDRATYFSDRPQHTLVTQPAANAATIRASSMSACSTNRSWTAVSRAPTLPPTHRRISTTPNFLKSIDAALDPRFGTMSPVSP